MKKRTWIAAGLAIVVLGGGAVAWAQYRNIEKPAFEVVAQSEDFEVREYAPMIVAEVTHTGPRSEALNNGFRRLAAYIFAQDRPGAEANAEQGEEIAMTSPVLLDQTQEIAMTSPVMQDGASDGDADGAWRTRFVMPSQYTLETLPQTPEDITLTEVPGRRMAAVRFSGSGTSSDLEREEARLRSWMAENSLEATGPAEYAFYDAPMVPSPLRRNEVMIPVE